MSYYKLGQAAAFEKLGMTPITGYGLGGAAVGALGGFGLADEGERLRGATLGAIGGGLLGSGVGGVKHVNDAVGGVRSSIGGARFTAEEALRDKILATNFRADALEASNANIRKAIAAEKVQAAVPVKTPVVPTPEMPPELDWDALMAAKKKKDMN